MNTAAAAKPRGGEVTSPVSTFSREPQATPERPPAAAIPAPISPPMNACVELLGRPAYHVARFQAIAPRRPAMMIGTVGALSSEAIVFDTALPKKTTVTSAPTRFRTAASTTA